MSCSGVIFVVAAAGNDDDGKFVSHSEVAQKCGGTGQWFINTKVIGITVCQAAFSVDP